MTEPITPRELAERFHELYEVAAPRYGYTIRSAARRPYDRLNPELRALMEGVCQSILDEYDIRRRGLEP